MYEYNKSIKSSASDELINTYVIRPIAGLIVRLLYRTRITPNHVTIASIVIGLIAAAVYVSGTLFALACGGLLVTLKDVLDSVDGQLARAKQQYSRTGRFLDSIGDFVVNAAVFLAIGFVLFVRHGTIGYFGLALLGLMGTTFRVSYHVFYFTSFLHRENKYITNRTIEEVQHEDRIGDLRTLRLQTIFQGIYGWQDRCVLRIDQWCRKGESWDELLDLWYRDLAALRLSALIGMGTELFVLTVFSLCNALEAYMYVNLVVLNGVLLFNIAFRRIVLRRTVAGGQVRSTL